MGVVYLGVCVGESGLFVGGCRVVWFSCGRRVDRELVRQGTFRNERLRRLPALGQRQKRRRVILQKGAVSFHTPPNFFPPVLPPCKQAVSREYTKHTLIFRKKSIRQCLLSACNTALLSANVSGAGDALTNMVRGAKTPRGAPADRAATCAIAVVAFRGVDFESWASGCGGFTVRRLIRILESWGLMRGWDWPMDGRGSWTHVPIPESEYCVIAR